MRAIIIASGDFNKKSAVLSSINEGDQIIAADGGAHHCLAAGLWPDIVIGDMDSITTSLLNKLRDHGSQLILYPQDKDQTDLELALNLAAEKGFHEVLILGSYGGRLDQSLANILLLIKDEWKDMRFTISNEPDTAYLMRGKDELSIRGHPGDIVSLIPLTPIVEEVSTQGLRWPLERAILKLGNTLSVSNEILDSTAHVQIGAGYMLLIHREAKSQEGVE